MESASSSAVRVHCCIALDMQRSVQHTSAAMRKRSLKKTTSFQRVANVVDSTARKLERSDSLGTNKPSCILLLRTRCSSRMQLGFFFNTLLYHQQSNIDGILKPFIGNFSQVGIFRSETEAHTLGSHWSEKDTCRRFPRQDVRDGLGRARHLLSCDVSHRQRSLRYALLLYRGTVLPLYQNFVNSTCAQGYNSRPFYFALCAV